MERLRNYIYMFTEAHPNSVARFPKPDRRRVPYTQPKSWCEFEDLIFVAEKSTKVPTCWSILGGGEEGDYNKLLKVVIHLLPLKEDFFLKTRSFLQIESITLTDVQFILKAIKQMIFCSFMNYNYAHNKKTMHITTMHKISEIDMIQPGAVKSLSSCQVHSQK